MSTKAIRIILMISMLIIMNGNAACQWWLGYHRGRESMREEAVSHGYMIKNQDDQYRWLERE